MRIVMGISVLAAFAAQSAFPLHFVSFGDQRTNQGTAQSVIDAISKVNPDLVLVSGDLWDGYGAANYKTMLTKNANISKLLDSNLYLVARGNHESVPEVLAFKPSIVRDGKELYSFTKGNSFFVCLAMDPNAATAFLEQQLQTPAAKAATWKFVYSHYPVYSTGDHGSQGMPNVEKICDKYGVNMVFNGHDHIYERSHQMYAGKVVDKGDALTAEKGTVYMVVGGGGAPLYGVGTATFSHIAKSVNNFTELTTDEHQITVKALNPSGAVIDAFTIAKGSTVSVAAQPTAPDAIKLNLVAAQRMAILSFDPINTKGGVLEIHSPTGALMKKNALAPGQTSLAWKYGPAAQGEYLAVLRDGTNQYSRKIPVLK